MVVGEVAQHLDHRRSLSPVRFLRVHVQLVKGGGVKRCCVLVPYHDEGPALLMTLESMREESQVVDVLVVDDGSVDAPAAQVTSGASLDHFVEILTLDDNVGLTAALNAGLERLTGRYDYVGRLDTGDRAVGQRFARQIAFLDANPAYGVVGCDAIFVDPAGTEVFTLRLPRSDEAVRRYMKINSAFTHPAVVMRSSAIEAAGDVYSHEYPAAEDYAAWWSLLKVSKGRNLPEVGLIYEVNPRSISALQRREQIRSRIRLMWNHFDFTPLALYGLLRAGLLLLAPRRLSTRLNSLRRRGTRPAPVAPPG